MSDLRLKSVLIVEDDIRLLKTLMQTIGTYAEEVRGCESVKDAERELSSWEPELLVLDLKLPDGNALNLLADISRRSPCPKTIAVSAFAKPEDTFQLAQLGVRAYLRKPIELNELEGALRLSIEQAPNIAPHIRSAVGTMTLKDMEVKVRNTMLTEALGRAKGSRRGASKILGISRQLVQYIIGKIY